MAPTISDVKEVGHTLKKGLNVAKAISASVGRTSITRLAKDSILQFPVIISSSIGTDECITMARAIEKYYASLVVSIFSLRSIDISKNDDIATYIKRFHNNSDIPSNIQAASTFIMESAQIINDPTLQAPLSDILACWNVITEQVDTESINDIYKPYTKTKNILSDKIDTLKIANETRMFSKDGKTNQFLDTVGGAFGGSNYQDRSIRNNDKTDNKTEKTVNTTDVRKDKDGEVVLDKNGKVIYDTKSVTTKDEKHEVKTSMVVPTKFNEIVRNDKLTALEPTMANIQFVLHGGTDDSKQWFQNVVLGFKSMVRMVRSDIMISNMIEASKNSNFIFKFIKWTSGEYKVIKDLIFNVSEIKNDAISSSKDKNFLSALKRRKAFNSIGRLADNRVPPSTMIIMTSYEVARVAESTGVNLTEVHNALSVLNKYYLLGFGIYNTETKILSTLFDGESEFSETTIDALKSSTPKSNDVSISDVMKLFGKI